MISTVNVSNKSQSPHSYKKISEDHQKIYSGESSPRWHYADANEK